MFLNESADFYGDDTLVASANFVGDASEMIEVNAEVFEEMTNLNIAVMRFEHRCLTENAGSEVLEEGFKEFIAKVKDTIKKWWNKFIEWLGSLWAKLKGVFQSRENWLKENKSKVLAKSDDDLKGLKVVIGSNVPNGSAEAGVKEFIADMQKSVTDAGSKTFATSDDAKQYVQLKKEAFGMKDKTAQAVVYDTIVGVDKEFEVNKTLVAKLVAAVASSTKAADLLGKVKSDVAGNALKRADKLEAKSKTSSNEAIVLRGIAPMIQALTSGISSALATVNSQAMSTLVKAANYKPSRESSNLLSQYM